MIVDGCDGDYHADGCDAFFSSAEIGDGDQEQEEWINDERKSHKYSMIKMFIFRLFDHRYQKNIWDYVYFY